MILSTLAHPLSGQWEDGVFLARPTKNVLIGYTSRLWADARECKYYPLPQLKGYLRQVQAHTDVVLCADSHIHPKAFDASYTQRVFWQLNGLFADCLPIYVGHKNGKWIGLVHSGWRGSLACIAVKLLKSLCSVTASEPKHWWAVLGPYRWGNDYEVQEDLKQRFFSQFAYPWLSSCFWRKDEKLYFDNGLFNLLLLSGLGIKNLKYLPFNTGSDSRFYSHRAGEQGRNLAFIYQEG